MRIVHGACKWGMLHGGCTTWGLYNVCGSACVKLDIQHESCTTWGLYMGLQYMGPVQHGGCGQSGAVHWGAIQDGKL